MVVGPNDISSSPQAKNGGRGGESYQVLSLKKRFMLVAHVHMTRTVVVKLITSFIEFTKVVSLQ
jgi:hypothetical protein